MKKIIFVPFLQAFGGVERLIVSLCKTLHGECADVTILCFRDTIGFATRIGSPTQIVELKPPRNAILEGWYLNRYLRRKCGNETSKVLVFDLSGAFYMGMFAPSGYTLHLTDPPSLLPTDISKFAPSVSQVSCFSKQGLTSEIVHRFNLRGLKKAHRVVVMTNYVRDETRRLYGVEASVVRPGIEISCIERSNECDLEDDFRFLSICRLEKSKRIDWIVSSLHNLENSVPSLSGQINWSLDIVGTGSQEQDLRRQVAFLGLDSKVTFHGHCSDCQVEELYKKASIFLMPAVQGYGLPALESLSRQVPVILHADSGVSEILGGSPWVSIISANEHNLEKHILIMIQRIIEIKLSKADLPRIPSDIGWSQEIISIWNSANVQKD